LRLENAIWLIPARGADNGILSKAQCIIEEGPMNLDTIMETIRDRIAGLFRVERFLHPNDQRLSWAKVVENRDDLPEVYRGFFDQLPAGEKEPFPYTIITPTYQGYLQPEKERVISRVDGSLNVLEEQDGKLAVTEYPLAEINYIETGTILLHSWFAVSGVDPAGHLNTTKVRFNSVTEHLFTPLVDALRPPSEAGGEADRNGFSHAFDSLADRNFKFMNYARRTVRPGENVAQYVLQPEIGERLLNFFGVGFTQRVAPAHIAILTGGELIFIRDDPTQHVRTKEPYGGIWDYIPLGKIQSVRLDPAEQGRLELSILFPHKQHLAFLYEEARKADVEKLRKQILGTSGR
jgi:hypothetical protein